MVVGSPVVSCLAMSWVERKSRAPPPSKPPARVARIGRKEAKLMDTYDYRKAKQQVQAAQWMSMNDEYGAFAGSGQPRQPRRGRQPQAVEESSPWTRSSDACGSHFRSGEVDALGVVDVVRWTHECRLGAVAGGLHAHSACHVARNARDLSVRHVRAPHRERELHEKAVTARRQAVQDRNERATLPSVGKLQPHLRHVEREALERELLEKASASRKHPIAAAY
eukprot:1336965-Prymnesium_polylepis.1